MFWFWSGNTSLLVILSSVKNNDKIIYTLIEDTMYQEKDIYEDRSVSSKLTNPIVTELTLLITIWQTKFNITNL